MKNKGTFNWTESACMRRKKDWSFDRNKSTKGQRRKKNIGKAKAKPIARKVTNNVTKSDITLESLGLSFTPTHKRISIV